MTLRNYAFVAAIIFTIVALLQLLRAASGWPVTVGVTAIPVWASWIAFVVAGGLAWAGFTAVRD
jgi:hypothetical protein